MKIRIQLNPGFYKINSLYFSSKIISTFNKSKIKFENHSEKYWLNKTANIDNMCGIGELNQEDLIHSKLLFEKLGSQENFRTALDVGAGIGRITFNVLYDKCEKIDMLDINKNFLDRALCKEKELNGNKINKLYATKIQNFEFERFYDLIFVQWVLEYLGDKKFYKFLFDCALNLNKDGFLIVKENVNTSDGTTLLIDEEGSFIRPPHSFENCFNRIGLSLIHDEMVKYNSVKDEIYDVKCWVLKKL